VDLKAKKIKILKRAMTGLAVYFIVTGILRFTTGQPGIAIYWAWIFLVVGVLATLGVWIRIKTGKTVKGQEVIVVDINFSVGLVIGLLLITYFAPLIANKEDSSVSTWVAFISGIVIVAALILGYLGQLVGIWIWGKVNPDTEQ